jgi:hypothetical protein
LQLSEVTGWHSSTIVSRLRETDVSWEAIAALIPKSTVTKAEVDQLALDGKLPPVVTRDDVTTRDDVFAMTHALVEKADPALYGETNETINSRANVAPPDWNDWHDDDLVQEAFPPRTKADLSLRRTRAPDVFRALQAFRPGAAAVIWDTAWRAGYDYIFLCNLGWMTVAAGTPWFTWWQAAGVFSLPTFTAASILKEVGTFIKMTRYDDWPNRLHFVENERLVGYRNPPVPGFNVFDQAAELASGGQDQEGWLPLSTFYRNLRLASDVPVHATWMTFKEYVMTWDWSHTKGSSSKGRMLVKIPGERKRVKLKARKNAVPGLLDLFALADDALANHKAVNITIVKPELGKLRIAVAGDIDTYLKEAFMMAVISDWYKSWPSVVAGEDGLSTMRLMAQRCELSNAGFSVPYDVAKFDHVVSISQQIVAHMYMGARGKQVLPATAQEEWQEIVDLITETYSHTTLVTRNGVDDVTVAVTGGLQSGRRTTSAQGNAFAVAMQWTAEDIGGVLSNTHSRSKAEITGDDVNIMDKRWRRLAGIALGYQLLKIPSGDYSIMEGQTEFLRIYYEDGVANGYLARCVPGILQRKPWSDQPWSEVSSWEAIWDAIRTSVRRGADEVMVEVWQQLAQVWSDRSGIDRRVLSIPTTLGGYGVGPPVTGLQVVPRAPRVSGVGLKVTNSNGAFGLAWAAGGEKFGVVPNAEQASKADQRKFETLVRTGAIPGAARAFRAVFKDLVKKWRGVVRQVEVVKILHFPYLGEVAPTAGGIDKVMALETTVPSFSAFRHLEPTWVEAQSYKSVDGFLPSTWFKRNEPGFWASLRAMEKRGWHRATALDWLFGSIYMPPLPSLNPIATRVVASATAYAVNIGIDHKVRRDVARGGVQNALVATALRTVEWWRQTALCRNITLW